MFFFYRDLNVSCKYKGYLNTSSQIKASFSHDGKYIISGSENRDIYIWKTNHDYSKFSSVRRDRNDFWEAIKAHAATVTCAIFAPNPESIIKMLEEGSSNSFNNMRSEDLESNKKILDGNKKVRYSNRYYRYLILIFGHLNRSRIRSWSNILKAVVVMYWCLLILMVVLKFLSTK